MKTIYILLASMLVACTAIHAQITIMKSKEVAAEPSVDIYEYDSLTNVLRKNDGYVHMIGQRLMLIHSEVKEERKRDRVMYNESYGGYYLSHLKDVKENGVDDEPYLGKYFRVNSYEKFGLSQNYVLRLKDEETNKILIYEPKFEWANSHFVCEGYFNKMKEMYIGKEYIFIEANSLSNDLYSNASNSLISLEDDKEFSPKNSSIWKCIDLTVKIDDKYNYSAGVGAPIIIIFQNSEGEKAYRYLQDKKGLTSMAYSTTVEYGKDINFVKRPLFLGCFVTKEENAKYIAEQNAKNLEKKKADTQKLAALTKKYGAANAKLIMSGKVKIGWTKSMCKASWGEPDKINTTTGNWGTHEQWVYGDNSFLYFENGKLTTIQN